MKKILPICLISLLFCACRKDRPPLPLPTDTLKVENTTARLLILNEGNFMMGNSGLSLHSFESGFTREDVYREVNGNSLGDVAQSMSLIGNELWIVVNNSGKIVVLDTADFKQKKVINGMQSPRYMLPLNGSVLVSDLYAQKLHLINQENKTLSAQIPFHTWTEEMAINDAGIWISAPYSRYVYRMQAPFTRISDSLEIGYRCSWLEQHADGKISGLSAGQGNEEARLWTIDNSGQLLQSQTLPFQAQTVHDLEFIDNRYYFLTPDGLFSVQDSIIKLIFPAGNRNFYSMSWLDNPGLLAITDAKDYVSRGEVLLLRPDGDQVILAGELKAGIIPGRMLVFE